MNNDKESKTSMANREKRREARGGSEVNQGNRLFAHGIADASSFIQMEVNQHTGGGLALSKIWQAPKQD